MKESSRLGFGIVTLSRIGAAFVEKEISKVKKLPINVGRYVQEYTKDLYQFLIRMGRSQGNKEKVVHYINGLRSSIQEELIMAIMSTIEDAYQFSLEVEGKLSKMFERRQT